MTPPLRFEREREGRIGVDVDRVDRIHLDRDGETHAPSCIGPSIHITKIVGSARRTAPGTRPSDVIAGRFCQG
jgi:hypothetical protein